MPVTQEEVREWSRHFYKALQNGSGKSLTECLEAATQQQTNQDFLRALVEVREIVARGYSLSTAMALHPHVFNDKYVTVIRYGELWGEVDLVLERYVEHPEDMSKPCRPKPI